jgi:hypothetical protein
VYIVLNPKPRDPISLTGFFAWNIEDDEKVQKRITILESSKVLQQQKIKGEMKNGSPGNVP